jgi:hypothetical protein
MKKIIFTILISLVGQASLAQSQYQDTISSALDQYGKELVAMQFGELKDGDTYWNEIHDRKEFWVKLITEMIRYESDFNPQSKYTEAFSDSTGQRVVSRGLLQISYESARGYGCPIKRVEDLHDSKLNIECGVRILNRWVPRDRMIGTNKLGGARYWAVLRESSKARAKIIEALKRL